MMAARLVISLLLVAVACQAQGEVKDINSFDNTAFAEDLDSDGFTAGRTLLSKSSDKGRGRGDDDNVNRRQPCRPTQEFIGRGERLYYCSKQAPRCTRQYSRGTYIYVQVVAPKCKCTCTYLNGCTTTCYTKPVRQPVVNTPKCKQTCVRIGRKKLVCTYYDCGPGAGRCTETCRRQSNGVYSCTYMCPQPPPPPPPGVQGQAPASPSPPPPPSPSPPPPSSSPSPSPPPPNPSPSPSPPPPNPSPSPSPPPPNPSPSPPPPNPSPSPPPPNPSPSPSPPPPGVTGVISPSPPPPPPPKGRKCGFTYVDGKKTKVFCASNQVCCRTPKSWGVKLTGPKCGPTEKVQPKCADACPQWCLVPVPSVFYACTGPCAGHD